MIKRMCTMWGTYSKLMEWPIDEQPIDEVRDYFGERIALYFCFLGHYTSGLYPLALAGIATYVPRAGPSPCPKWNRDLRRGAHGSARG